MSPANLVPGVYVITCPVSPFVYLSYCPFSPQPYMLHTPATASQAMHLDGLKVLRRHPTPCCDRHLGGCGVPGLVVVR